MNINPQMGGEVRDIRGTSESAQKLVKTTALKVASDIGSSAEVVRRVAGESVSGVKQTIGSAATSGARLVGSVVSAIPHPSVDLIKPVGKYNTFYKIIVLFLFLTVFLKVIINIFRFFGIDIIDLYSYMGWVVFLLIILIFIPHDYSTLKLN
jgi:hypothetical protein